MATVAQISISSLAYRLSSLHNEISKKPIKYFPLSRTKIGFLKQSKFRLQAYWDRDGILVEDEGWKRKKNKKRVVEVRLNQGFGGFNGGGGGGGGGGGKDDGATARLLGNLAVAIGLTYLSFTGQLGWLLDAIVSIWLIAVLVPIVGVGAFLWWAGRDMVQDSCPNCGNAFQIFKSTLNDDLQLCPYCSQPFSVVDDKFVMDPIKFSKQSTTFGQAFNDFTRSTRGYPSNPSPFFSSRSYGKDSSKAVVDIEAEVKDAD